jgi:hypothetical protein
MDFYGLFFEHFCREQNFIPDGSLLDEDECLLAILHYSQKSPTAKSEA